MSDNERDNLPAVTDGEDAEAFDPEDLPGAQVIYSDDDFKAVAVPLSALGGTDVPPEVLSLLAGAGGSPLEAVDAVLTSYRQMNWALEEVDAAKARHGETDPETFDTAFPLLRPADDHPFLAPEPIFRAHCVELLDRVAAGEDLSAATEAEIFGLLVDASKYQPFCGGLTSLYLTLAKKITPEPYAEFLQKEAPGSPEELEEYHAVHAEDAAHHRKEINEILSRDRSNPAAKPESKYEPFDELSDILSALSQLGFDPNEG
jgi:hypothetical protein